MPHDELTALLPEITGPSGQFRHRQHIHLAFLAVRRYGMPEATTRICDWIQHIAALDYQIELVLRSHDGAGRTRKRGCRGNRAGSNEKIASGSRRLLLAGRRLG